MLTRVTNVFQITSCQCNMMCTQLFGPTLSISHQRVDGMETPKNSCLRHNLKHLILIIEHLTLNLPKKIYMIGLNPPPWTLFLLPYEHKVLLMFLLSSTLYSHWYRIASLICLSSSLIDCSFIIGVAFVIWKRNSKMYWYKYNLIFCSFINRRFPIVNRSIHIPLVKQSIKYTFLYTSLIFLPIQNTILSIRFLTWNI